MNSDDFADDSDSSDEDYIPGAKPEEVVSEVDSDGDAEEPLSDTESSPKRKRRKCKKSRSKKSKSDPDDDNEKITETPKQEISEEEKKKQADALWADFLQDTGFKSKESTGKKTQTNSQKKTNSSSDSLGTESEKKKQEKIKITEIFEFAGEEVKVEKEVAKDSVEARLLGNTSSDSLGKPRRGNLSGIGSVLSQLGKKKKITTLEKTKLDWDRFKKEENLEDELLSHNKGKDGYLDRQDFLQRADLRRFEIEKEVRAVERNKRMNMGEPF